MRVNLYAREAQDATHLALRATKMLSDGSLTQLWMLHDVCHDLCVVVQPGATFNHFCCSFVVLGIYLLVTIQKLALGLITLSGSVPRANAITREAQPSIFSRFRSRAGLINPVPFCVFQRRFDICQRITGLLPCASS